MASILVCYGTGEGQTAKVADRIADKLTAHGHETTTINVKEIDSDLDIEDFDAVLVGASIHMGRHQKTVRRFVSTNRGALVTKPTGLFQVSGASGEETEKGEAEAAGYIDEFIEATDWRPDRIGLFGGALRFSEYGFLLRSLMKRIARKEHPEVDTSNDVEFTDWESVTAFADDFATFVGERTGEAVDTNS
ncbi:flavodoxin domain-containing protein [Halomicrococcus sp. NG-SE-24]|uniref:flavodoxin domain-containing protein n=1 Tax=Halomicrococcus sp. NG-SE-24 TaxID=3436928 RepID=UPI003D9880B5